MKKIFFIPILFAFSLSLQAQEPADALRYSWYVQNGTARQQAIGGAMGSLGGDISATFVNPAGLGFYRTSDFVITPGYNFSNNKSTWFNRTEKGKKNNVSFGPTGFVIGGGGRNNRGKMKSSAFSMVVNRTANFNSTVLYRGQNNQSSYSQKFLEEIKNSSPGLANPNSVANDFTFGTSLAFNTYWIDTIRGSSGSTIGYQSRAANIGNLLQQNTIKNKGGITDLALGFAANFNEKFFAGGTFGIPILSFERESEFIEADPTDNAANKFNFASFKENFSTKGIGLNLKLGLIYKPVEQLRLGLAFHTPTYFNLTDKFSYEVTTDTEGYGGVLTQASTSNQFSNPPSGEFKYTLLTPYRVIGSVSYVLHEVEDVKKQKGFITADIEYVNHKASSFGAGTDVGVNDPNYQSNKDYFKSLNKAIDNAYKGALNFRVGGELKFTTLMVRAGAAYYGNPYKNLNGEKGSKLLLSGGLGYRHKGMFIDLTYVHNILKDVNTPYRLQYSKFSTANIKGMAGNAVLTVGFKI
jgi:hypothetical protein